MTARRRLSPSEAELVRHLRPDRAANILIQSFADCAGEHALIHALIAERDIDPARATFWASVYEQIRQARNMKK